MADTRLLPLRNFEGRFLTGPAFLLPAYFLVISMVVGKDVGGSPAAS